MKLPKIDKFKKPDGLKMSGGLNTPVKRFTIKNRFLQKNLISLIVVAVLAIGTGTAYGTLSSRDADRGNDPVNGVNKDRYQVLVSGNGFKLSKKQEKDYKLQKKQNQVNAARAAQAAQTNPSVIRTSSGNRVFRTSAGNFRYKPRTSTFKTSKVPRITTDISTEIYKLDEPKAGDTFKIKVVAYAYPYGTKNTIPSDNIEVKISSGKVELYKEDKGTCFYKVELGEGEGKNKTVKITVTATDKKNKKTSKIGPFIIKDVEGSGNSGSTDPTNPSSSTDPTDPSTPTTENKTFAISANYGSFSDVTMDVDDSTTVGDVLTKAGITVSGSEVTKVPGNFSSAIDDINSDTLKSIYRAEKNIPEDEEINQDDYDDWVDELKDEVKNGVSKGSPFNTTYWECSPSVGTKAKDASSITLTLHIL